MTIDQVRGSAPFLLPEGLPLLREVRSARDLAQALFIDALARRGFGHVREFPLRIAPDSVTTLIPASASSVFGFRDDHGEVTVFGVEDGVIQARLSRGSGDVMVAAASSSAADRLAERISAMVGGSGAAEDSLPVTFWTSGRFGAQAVQREIAAPAWDTVAPNYERVTACQLGALVHALPPSAGRLILWHGPPGTGKTTALRALSRTWSAWCATHFITDPEQFLGGGTGYLLDVVTAHPSRSRSSEPHHKMVVLEDSGELLTVDAHQRTGQALSRLLNLTDGLLGQGTNVVVLVTSNEPLRSLHPAVTRPGRCWCTIDFQPFSIEEANRWLTAHDSDSRVTQPVTLAEAYGVLRGLQPEARRPVGFAPSAS